MSDGAGMTRAHESPAPGVLDPESSSADDVELSLVATMFAAVTVGAGLAVAARVGATALLVAVALTQALLAGAWIYGTVMPGRKGALVLATLASAGADVAVSLWPHGRLGALLGVLGLAVPAMFVHQLTRGAIRVRVVSSLSAVAMLLLGEVSLTAVVQLRHEFGPSGGVVSSGVVVAVAGPLVIGALVDMLVPAPRFDPEVARGLLGLIASAGLGGSVGYLMLHDQAGFAAARAAFVGAALGAVAGLVAVGCAFVLHTTPHPRTTLGRVLRPGIGALLPIALLCPAAFLLCLAIRP